jgi:hypothetical protein
MQYKRSCLREKKKLVIYDSQKMRSIGEENSCYEDLCGARL